MAEEEKKKIVCPLCGKDLSVAGMVLDDVMSMHMKMHFSDTLCKMFEFIHRCAYLEKDREVTTAEAFLLIDEITAYNKAIEIIECIEKSKGKVKG